MDFAFFNTVQVISLSNVIREARDGYEVQRLDIRGSVAFHCHGADIRYSSEMKRLFLEIDAVAGDITTGRTVSLGLGAFITSEYPRGRSVEPFHRDLTKHGTDTVSKLLKCHGLPDSPELQICLAEELTRYELIATSQFLAELSKLYRVT